MKYANAILKPFLILTITVFLTPLVPSVAAEFLPFEDNGKAIAAQLNCCQGYFRLYLRKQAPTPIFTCPHT